MINGLESAIRDVNNEIISQANICMNVLAHEDQKYGNNTDTKHKRKDEGGLQERHIYITHRLVVRNYCAEGVLKSRWMVLTLLERVQIDMKGLVQYDM